jgi:hypothetical protein
MFLAPYTSTPLQTTLAADAQFSHEEQALNNAKSLMYRAGTEVQEFPKQKNRI